MNTQEKDARLRQRLQSTYLAVLDECIAGLELARDVQDTEQAAFWAHKLRPSSAVQGHAQLASACAAVDDAVEDGADWPAVATLLDVAIVHAGNVPRGEAFSGL